MRKILFLLAATAVLFSGCKQEPDLVLPSGFECVMHTDNSNTVKPNNTDLVYFNFNMRSDDSVVMTSFDRPMPEVIRMPDSNSTRRLNPVEEALQLMGIGDSATVIIPLDTVDNKPPGFENSRNLYYDLVVVDIKSTLDLEEAVENVGEQVQKTISSYAEGTLENLITTESGLKVLIEEEGQGVQPQAGDLVYVDYYGALTDGNMFDNSFGRGRPIAFPLGMGQVIRGWDEGIAMLKLGSKATLFIPAELGYGETGSPPVIPGNSELIFYVHLRGVVQQ